jgi:hypothetical protein
MENMHKLSFTKLIQICICDVFTLNYIWRSVRFGWHTSAFLSTGTLTLPYLHHFPVFKSDAFMAFVIFFWPTQHPLDVTRTPSLPGPSRVYTTTLLAFVVALILSDYWKPLQLHRRVVMYLLTYLLWIGFPFLILSWLPLSPYQVDVVTSIWFFHFLCNMSCKCWHLFLYSDSFRVCTYRYI